MISPGAPPSHFLIMCMLLGSCVKLKAYPLNVVPKSIATTTKCPACCRVIVGPELVPESMELRLDLVYLITSPDGPIGEPGELCPAIG